MSWNSKAEYKLQHKQPSMHTHMLSRQQQHLMQIYAITAYFDLFPHFSHISAKCAYRVFFLHKLAFSMAILILVVFLLPISIGFRYLDHLIVNRMAPSMWNEMG